MRVLCYSDVRAAGRLPGWRTHVHKCNCSKSKASGSSS